MTALSSFNLISFSEQMINSVFLGVLIAGLAWVLLRVFSSGNSKTRFAVWLAVLLAVVGLPLLGWTAAPVSAAAPFGPHLSVSSSWAEYALVTWGIISAIGIIRIGIGLLRLTALRRRCRPVSIHALPAEAQKLFRNFACRRHVEVFFSEEVKAPTAIGFFHPAILLPIWALDNLSAVELRAVLLHELGHLSRFDDWTNLLQKLARAVLFFHPAVWWIDSKLCLEREIACDDLVVAQTGDSRSYAQCLVSLAEKSMMHRGMALAVAAVGHMRQMAHRLTVILDPARTASNRISKVAVASAITIAFAGLAASPHLPALVIFQDGNRSVAAADAIQPKLDVVPRVNVNLSSSNAGRVNVVPAVFRVSGNQQATSQRASVRETSNAGKKQTSVSKRKQIRAALQIPKREAVRAGVLLVVEAHFSVNPMQSLWIGDDLAAQDFNSMPQVSLTIFRFEIGNGNRIVHSEFVSHVI